MSTSGFHALTNAIHNLRFLVGPQITIMMSIHVMALFQPVPIFRLSYLVYLALYLRVFSTPFQLQSRVSSLDIFLMLYRFCLCSAGRN